MTEEQMAEIDAIADFIFSDIPFLTDLFQGPLHPCYCGQYKGECEWDHEWRQGEYDPDTGQDSIYHYCENCGAVREGLLYNEEDYDYG